MNKARWHSSIFFHTCSRTLPFLQSRQLCMAQSNNVSLSSAAYLFHHENIQIDTDSLKHHDPIFSVKWTGKSKAVNSNSDASLNESQSFVSWHIRTFRSALNTKWLGQTLVFSESMESTQTFTKQLLLPQSISLIHTLSLSLFL